MTPPPAASSAQPLAPPRRRPVAPARPRRVSGPARPAKRPTRDAGQQGLVLGAIGTLDSLSNARWLDRLIRGRLWIGIVAFALIGIVTLQLGLLKLNSSIGRALEKEGQLQRTNAALSIENSELASGARVESQAERLGMKLVAVGGLKFRDSHERSDVPRAAQALSTPVKPVESTPSEAATSTTSAEGEKEASSEQTASTNESTAGGEVAPTEEHASETGEAAAPAASGTSEASAPAASGTSEAGGGGTAAPEG